MAKITYKSDLKQINKRPHLRYYIRYYLTPLIYMLWALETGYLIYAYLR